MKCSNDKPIVHCKNCKFKVTDKDGNYNPYDIVCEYWNSDGLEENDFCSNGIEGKFEYDELAVTSDGKTYDEIVQESLHTALSKLEDDEKYSCETKVKAPVLRFMLDGCDISYAAEAPADMTLAQLLKQCDRIHPDYCACGIRSTDDEPELIFGYDSVDYVRGETGYAECSIDGVNPPECMYCKYLVKAAEKGWIGKCGNKNSRFYDCLRDAHDTCELQEVEKQ